MPKISNGDLRPDDLPPSGADLNAFFAFANTFDGCQRWGSLRDCALIAYERRHGSLDELRTCLFFELRRYRHWGHGPNEEGWINLRDLVEKIRVTITRVPGT